MESLENENTPKSESFEKFSAKEKVVDKVRGLRSIHVGDSSFIKKLEENAKESIDPLHCIVNEENKSAENVFIDGQGDATIQAVSKSLIANELIAVGAFCSRNEVKPKSSEETIQESSCFLPEKNDDMENQKSAMKIQEISKIGYVIKEETELPEESKEKLIEIITLTANDEIDSKTDNIEEGIEIREQSMDELSFKDEKPKLYSPPLTKVSFSRGEFVEEIVIEEVGSFPLSSDVENLEYLPAPPPKLPLPPVSVNNSKLETEENSKAHNSGKSKKWLGNKLRKLFHFFYGKNKH